MALKKTSLHIIAAAGTQLGKDNLSRAATSLELTKFCGLSYARELRKSASISSELENFLRDVGRHCIAWARYKVDDIVDLTPEQLEDCEKDALGYSGARALISTPMNVPVGTLMALWCPGIYKNIPWSPLLIRRGYLQHLIMS